MVTRLSVTLMLIAAVLNILSVVFAMTIKNPKFYSEKNQKRFRHGRGRGFEPSRLRN